MFQFGFKYFQRFGSSYNSTREPSERILAVSQPDMYENLRTKLGKAELKLEHINVRGLLGKFNEITLLLEESNIDILAITENHLDRSVWNETVEITGYEVERHDQDKNGGGCLLKLGCYSEQRYECNQSH